MELETLTKKYPRSRLVVVQIDVTEVASIQKAVEELTTLLPNGLDYLVNNAGIHPQPLTSFQDLDLKLFEEEVLFNTVVPVQVTRPLIPLIRKSQKKKVVFITSVLGSIELGFNTPGLSNSYSTAKAALNMLARKWGAELKSDGITVVTIHPGWVGTEIGEGIRPYMEKFAAHVPLITISQSSEGLIKVIQDTKLDDSTVFYNFDGTRLPW